MQTTGVLVLVVAALCVGRADAQQLSLAILDGRVTLDARDVPLRQILTEWARVGGVQIVNGETITGAPVSLRLADTPERQALDILLRDASGYLLAARQAGATGLSTFDRILILPTSVAPRAPAPVRASNPPAANVTFGTPDPGDQDPAEAAADRPQPQQPAAGPQIVRAPAPIAVPPPSPPPTQQGPGSAASGAAPPAIGPAPPAIRAASPGIGAAPVGSGRAGVVTPVPPSPAPPPPPPPPPPRPRIDTSRARTQR